jgi:hypothetical protein
MGFLSRAMYLWHGNTVTVIYVLLLLEMVIKPGPIIWSFNRETTILAANISLTVRPCCDCDAALAGARLETQQLLEATPPRFILEDALSSVGSNFGPPIPDLITNEVRVEYVIASVYKRLPRSLVSKMCGKICSRGPTISFVWILE